MIERIKMILKSMNITSSEFADKIQVQRSGVSHILTGRNKPSLDFVTKVLISYPEINSDWLLFGKGKMTRSDLPESSIDKTEIKEKEKSAEKATTKDDKKVPLSNKEDKEKGYPGPHKSLFSHSGIKKIIILFENNEYREFTPD